ncbi:phosphocholine cytidylyltransferase family protein [Algiphilus sp. W345]|uniref:Phosphocholine cytidylyltransferase family protein n=1 Tax=Banduia mediterranea TaxID=3075609 RepID=A0ABU2WLL1_9GAMM|nr:phosphocholine cytidylyltransferase family protein [Algiphilus sp. W345]MDT0498773.1 phosphocholine cytidylyltransferase family protein [Algiphilus sp. W345]
MQKPERAIILSAGQGSRLLPLTEQMPKCLIDISGRSMLEWQLQGLAAVGLRETVVVTGFRADLVEEALRRITPAGLRVRTLFNPFYKLADNLASCWMVREEFKGGCLLINGDTLFEAEIARRLVASPAAPITVAIDRKPRYDSDDMKVETAGDRLRAIGKTLAAEQVTGESIGFLRFDADGAACFVDEIERTMRTAEGPGLWYLSAIHKLAKAGTDVRTALIEGLQWGELDFQADLVRARALTAGWLGNNDVSGAQAAALIA